MKVHPDADIFPMMPDDDLAALAEDIKSNGLIHPIITGDYRFADAEKDEEVLIDGRNRLQACKIAGVKPTFKKLNGENQKAFILSANVNRRHMSAGQRAMATAMLYPVPVHAFFKKGTSSLNEDVKKVPSVYLSMARTVLANAPDLAKAVMNGSTPLSSAYDETKQRDGTAKNKDVRLRRLRELRPDLADRVLQEDVSIEAAEAQAKTEAEARKQQRWAATINLIDGVKLLDRDIETVPAISADFDPSIVEQRGETFTPARLRRAAAFLSALADVMEQ